MFMFRLVYKLRSIDLEWYSVSDIAQKKTPCPWQNSLFSHCGVVCDDSATKKTII
jgi:hypothetical protein